MPKASNRPANRPTHAADQPPANGRDKLIHAGLKLFAEQGYDGTSVRALAAEAGVSFGLIRKYFGSKEGLRDTIEEYVITRLHHFYDSSLPTDHLSADTAAESSVAFFAEERDVLLYLRFALLHPQKSTQKLVQRYFDMYTAVIAKLDQNGQLDVGADRRWGAFLLMFMQLGPLLIEPFSEQLLGESVYSPAMLRERQHAYLRMLTEPFLKN